jgi:thioredoxin-dependent peroxiredoxin
VNYPMIGDPELKVAKLYGMLPAESGTTSEGRTAADNATVRTVFVVGPDKKIKLQLSYPMSTGATSTKCCACSIRCSSRRSTKWPRR